MYCPLFEALAHSINNLKRFHQRPEINKPHQPVTFLDATSTLVMDTITWCYKTTS